MRIVVEQFFEEPLEEDGYAASAKRLDVALAKHAAAWRRSYLSTDRMRLTCEFEAADEETVRAAYREADVPCHDSWVAEVSAVEDYPELMDRLRAAVAGQTAPPDSGARATASRAT